MTWLINFFTKSALGLNILKFGAIIFAVVAVLFGARQAGKNAERIDQLKANQKAARKAHEIDIDIDRLPDGAASNELFNDWKR